MLYDSDWMEWIQSYSILAYHLSEKVNEFTGCHIFNILFILYIFVSFVHKYIHMSEVVRSNQLNKCCNVSTASYDKIQTC